MSEEEDSEAGPRVLELRGELAMLASEVAAAFGVETRQVVQNIKKNPVKLPARYAFELTDAEVESLRSLGVISNQGRGGSRALPWALTQKGVIRLATIMESPKALEATDLVIDVFAEVMTQLAQGRARVSIAEPERLLPSPDLVEDLAKIRKRLLKAVDNLLDTTIDTQSGATVREELGDIAASAASHVKEILRTRKVGNEKIEAETVLILEQARDLYERRQSDLKGAAIAREREALSNFEKKIGIVERLLKLKNELEPNALVELFPAGVAPRALPPPKKKK